MVVVLAGVVITNKKAVDLQPAAAVVSLGDVAIANPAHMLKHWAALNNGVCEYYVTDYIQTSSGWVYHKYNVLYQLSPLSSTQTTCSQPDNTDFYYRLEANIPKILTQAEIDAIGKPLKINNQTSNTETTKNTGIVRPRKVNTTNSVKPASNTETTKNTGIIIPS